MRTKLTEYDCKGLRVLMDKGCSDSDVEDYCKGRNLSLKVAFHYIAAERAPECCKKCGNVGLYPSMPPCVSCARPPRRDFFVEYKG